VARLPLSLSKAVDAWKEASAKTAESAGITLAGDPDLVAAAQSRLSSGGTLAATWARPLVDLAALSSVPGELLVIFVRPEEESAALTALGPAAPKGGAIVAVDEGAAATGRAARPFLRCHRLSFSDDQTGWARLFSLCAEIAGDKAPALGRRYPALRPAVLNRLIYRTAAQNALIGIAFFVPGADMPVMTANQIKMVLAIAGIYGAEVDRERAVELAGVVAAGFGLRAVARSLVRSIPGIGLVIKAATGYVATVTLGMAAVRYFEAGAPASTSRLVGLASGSRLAGLAGSLRGRESRSGIA
jgi:uncharacterized protein (DUF697 family)